MRVRAYAPCALSRPLVRSFSRSHARDASTDVRHTIEQDPRNPLYLHVARYISRLHQRAAQQEQQLAAAAAEVQRRSGGGAQPITLQPTTIQATNVTPIAAGSTNVIAPETKKRKLEDDTTSAAMTSSVGVAWDAPAAVIVSDLSFSLPARRKLSLELVKDCGIRVTNAQGEVECRMAFADIGAQSRGFVLLRAMAVVLALALTILGRSNNSDTNT